MGRTRRQGDAVWAGVLLAAVLVVSPAGWRRALPLEELALGAALSAVVVLGAARLAVRAAVLSGKRGARVRRAWRTWGVPLVLLR